MVIKQWFVANDYLTICFFNKTIIDYNHAQWHVWAYWVIMVSSTVGVSSVAVMDLTSSKRETQRVACGRSLV